MDNAYIGTIVMFAGNFAPKDWAFCEGQLIAISQNQALYSIIGTTYGGDGRTTFALPDLRGRVPVGTGKGPGLTPCSLGDKSGVERVTLIQSEMPAHGHQGKGTVKGHFTPPSGGANSYNPSDSTFSGSVGNNVYTNKAPNVEMAQGNVSVEIYSTGENQSHFNMQPYIGMNFIICLQGLYPPRN